MEEDTQVWTTSYICNIVFILQERLGKIWQNFKYMRNFNSGYVNAYYIIF